MRFVFIHTHAFRSEAAALRLTLDDIRGIENAISEAPHRWPVVPGAPGLRKMRFAPEGRAGGKSGGVRVCYFVVDRAMHVHLITVFAKNDKVNLNPRDVHAIRELIARIKNAYE